MKLDAINIAIIKGLRNGRRPFKQIAESLDIGAFTDCSYTCLLSVQKALVLSSSSSSKNSIASIGHPSNVIPPR